MKTLTQQLTKYAAYHRDPRNVATHFVGIPMIVLAVAVLMARPAFDVGGFAVSPALFAVLATVLYYLLLDIGLGLLMGVLLALCLWFAHWSVSQGTTVWLSIGLSLLVVGWIIQFVGHYYEGRKPAFVDDITGLIIGPLFVVAEALFMMGLRRPLQEAIEAEVGGLRKQTPKHA
jgi:uncharacterized membrane protein YGL010W